MCHFFFLWNTYHRAAGIFRSGVDADVRFCILAPVPLGADLFADTVGVMTMDTYWVSVGLRLRGQTEQAVRASYVMLKVLFEIRVI